MILNLTQHAGTPAQIAEGLYEPEDKQAVQRLLTFSGIPTREVINDQVRALVNLAKYEIQPQGDYRVLIGGMPALMGPLELALRDAGLIPVYAHSERVSKDVHNTDGTVTKTQVFEHLGFYQGFLTE